ncbi:MAG: PSD1 and planctomycete cytochrome C domain-containing protein [Planctomycetaceae bacterium]
MRRPRPANVTAILLALIGTRRFTAACVAMLAAATMLLAAAANDGASTKAESSATAPGPAAGNREADAIDFAARVRPIFQAKCVRCHGDQKQEGGVRFDHRDSAFQGGDSGPVIVAGKSGESLLIERVAAEDEFTRMPPDGEGDPLTKEEIALVRRWIDEGANWPDAVAGSQAVRSDHWAYQPIRRPPLPAVKNADWPRNDIDRFVLARLEAERIAPSPAADRHTLIKRLHYDLLGLPPTPAEVDAFVNDPAPDAYETLVDRLLASPHFGERWGRHWLDKARYADSDGYEKDNPRPTAWRYRDWVIEAINDDMPFDRFTVEQLAGDLLPDARAQEKLATAFHRQTLTNTEGGVDQEEFRHEALFDRVSTTSTVWLGLTVACAQCHTHKYDAITQTEYYQFFAFFNNADETTMRVPITEEAAARYDRELPIWEARLKELEGRLDELRGEYEKRRPAWEEQVKAKLAAAKESDESATDDQANDGNDKDAEKKDEIVPEAIAKILVVEPRARTDAQKNALLDHLARDDEPYQETRAASEEHKKQRPKDGFQPVAIIAQRSSPRTSRLLRRGDFLQPAEEVQPGVPQVLHELRPRDPQKMLDRLDLANWLIDEKNPLTPRVAVNHVWANLFGKGLVPTMNDFGVRGEAPTHPELLDWLADEFRRLGWSRKQFIRTIVVSATYRQSSAHRAELSERDPTNRLLHRQNRFRVEAEIVRDVYLAASGLLSKKIGGPSVFPPMPPDVAALSYANNFKWNTSKGEDRYRRGMYTFFKRTAPHPALMTFDCPDANTTKVERDRSNTPLQALTTLNNEVFLEAAQSLARRVLNAEGATSDADRLTLAFRLCTSRPPDDYELQRLTDLLEIHRAHYREHPDDAKKLAREQKSQDFGTEEMAAWTATARILLNLDEVITRE